ncbi:MAG: pilus assembly protein [Planctomycetales bacterium]|nr:pilus assembly protein [Planctomycetales bacterium]MCA9169866.1 pilus assembly protein [Planctomycetales bacterium]
MCLLKRKRKTRRNGLAVVEFAVMLPILTLIVFATIEATSMIFLQQSLEIAAYEGTRASLVPDATESEVSDIVDEILNARGVQSATVTVDPLDFNSQPYGTFIHVSVSAPCNDNSLLAPWFYRGRTLTADVEMMKEY